MAGDRSVLRTLAGFSFWIGIAYCFWRRDFWGAVWFVAAAGVVWGVWLLLRSTRAHRAREEEPPPSDLPEYDFRDARPKDFE